ncbi:MAG: cyclic nucleotide-binding domain-containing protein [Cyanobacteria bacterium J06634_5]
MSNILLQELSNADIDWLVTTGTRQTVAPQEALVRPGESPAALYVVLEGSLSVHWPGTEPIQKDTLTSMALAQLSRGDVVGEGLLFGSESVLSVTASTQAVVLRLPKEILLKKVTADTDFAAHFYRALALIVSAKIRRLFEDSALLRYRSGQMVKEALFVFGELRDSDIDWMIRTGHLEKLAADRVLLNAGRPVDALYTVLDGQLTIATTQTPCDPLSTCSHGLEELSASQNFEPIAYLSRGGLPGIISFLDFQPLPVRISTARESLLLAIPRKTVAIKLQEDLGFAARFYRVIATQAATLLTTVAAAGHISNCGSPGPAADPTSDELDMETLQQVSEGGAKFDWMLRHLGVTGGAASANAIASANASGVGV